MELRRLGAPGCEIHFTAYHLECKLSGFIQQHMKEKNNRGPEAFPSCDKLWICRFVEVLNNMTQLENIIVVQMRSVCPAGFNREVSGKMLMGQITKSKKGSTEAAAKV